MGSKIRLHKICEFCGSSFVAKTTVTKYCGDTCAKRAYKARKRQEKVDRSDEETRKVLEKSMLDIQAREFLSIQETAKLLGVSRTTIWRMIKRDQLRATYIGKRVIIRRVDIEDIFE